MRRVKPNNNRIFNKKAETEIKSIRNFFFVNIHYMEYFERSLFFPKNIRIAC